MRKTLLATTALAAAGAFAAGPVLAADMADKIHIGLGGYMEQWVGGTDITEPADGKQESVFDIRSDSEIYFTGSIQSDIGLTFGVKVELEADASGSGSGGIDESVVTVGGGFGTFHIGAEDGVQPIMHYGVPDVGIGLNAGDVSNWIPTSKPTTWSTSLWSAGNDQARLIYYTPRINGVQLGVSYAPDMTAEVSDTLVNLNDKDELHVQKKEAAAESNSLANNNEDSEVSIAANFDQAVGDAHIKASIGYSVTTTDSRSKAVADSAGRMHTKGFGDTADFNIGGQVTMSGFTVAAAYSEVDAEEYTGSVNSGRVVFTEDRTKDVEVMALGVSYADGPMALSASWSEQQRGGGNHDTATAFMLSASYLLAPGVEIKSSLFTAEDETHRVTTGFGADGMKGGTGTNADTVASSEGTAFVVGLKIGF